MSFGGESLGVSVLELRTDDKDFNKGIDAAKLSAEGLTSAFTQVSKLAAGIGVAVVAAFGLIAKATADYGDELDVASQRTGMTVEQLAKLKFAAGQADAQFSDVTVGLKIFANTIDAAGQGSKAQAAAFDRIGISVKNADGSMRPMNDVLGDVADKFRGLPDGVIKAAIAQDLFGKGGMALIPVLNAGSKGLDEMGQKAEYLGIVMSSDAAKAGDAFNDSLDDLQKAFMGAAFMIGEHLLPPLTSLVSAFTKAVVSVSGWLRQNPELIQSFVRLGKIIITAGIEQIRRLTENFTFLADVIGKAAYALGMEGLAAKMDMVESFSAKATDSLLQMNAEFNDGVRAVENSNVALPKYTTHLKDVGEAAEEAAKKHKKLFDMEVDAAITGQLEYYEKRAEMNRKAADEESAVAMEAHVDYLMKRAAADASALEMELDAALNGQSEYYAARAKLDQDMLAMEVDSALQAGQDGRDAADKTIEHQRQAYESLFGSVKQTASRTFSDIFKDGEFHFSALADTVKGVFATLANEILSNMTAKLLTPLISRVNDALSGLLGSFGGIFGLAGSGASAAGGTASAGSSAAGGIPGLGGAVGSAGSGIAGGLISGGLAAAGSIIGALMGEGNARRTEENTRETRDWLELMARSWDPVFHGQFDFIKEWVQPAITDCRDLLNEINYNVHGLAALSTATSTEAPMSMTVQIVVPDRPDEAIGALLCRLLSSTVQNGNIELVASRVRT